MNGFSLRIFGLQLVKLMCLQNVYDDVYSFFFYKDICKYRHVQRGTKFACLCSLSPLHLTPHMLAKCTFARRFGSPPYSFAFYIHSFIFPLCLPYLFVFLYFPYLFALYLCSIWFPYMFTFYVCPFFAPYICHIFLGLQNVKRNTTHPTLFLPTEVKGKVLQSASTHIVDNTEKFISFTFGSRLSPSKDGWVDSKCGNDSNLKVIQKSKGRTGGCQTKWGYAFKYVLDKWPRWKRTSQAFFGDKL